MSVCLCVHCTFGHFNIWSWPNVQYEVFESLYRSVTPKITGKAHVNRRPTSVFRHGSSRPLFPCRNHKGHCPGETGSFLWLSFSRQERARNRLCRYLYWISNKELRRLASYYAQSNFYVPANVPYLFRDVCVYVCMCVCISTACLGILI